MRKILLSLVVAALATSSFAQRITDKIDRGLVAVPSATSGNFVSWRIFGEEYYDVTYNLYCNGSLIASNLTTSNYNHSAGNSTSNYQVAAVVRGVEQEKSNAVKRWNNGYLEIPVQPIKGRNGVDVTAYYTLNDVSMGDLDGDGVVEFIVKRPCSLVTDLSQTNCFHVLDAYDRTGKRLWWIDLGPNMLAGADEQWDCVCYDWDQDGKAEVLLRIQDNAYIHYPDGTSLLIGNSTLDTRWNGIEYTSSGNEYLLYLEGATGKPYQIGPSSHPNYLDYPLTRGSDSDWGSGIVGHRSTKHYFAAPFFDGRHASIFLGRGAYTKHKMAAFDVDPATHKLTQRWYWENSTVGPWFGQGYHNFQIADVDWDGRDEVVFGSMIIDDNGKGLSTTGLGHGDSQHCSDFDPYRKYSEQFACNEEQPSNNFRNACTSQLYFRLLGAPGADDGRALMGNFTNDYPGSVGRSVASGWIGSCCDKIITELNGDAFINWGDLNSRIYWDGDLCDEYLESPGTEGYAVVYKPAGTGNRLLSATGTKLNNYTKNNPGGQGDIFGDWREEVILRTDNNMALRIYTTNRTTEYRIPTLWHDHQYRNAMVWQSMGYNQCPHKSYFLGQLEGITYAPAPLTMTGRTEVKNGGTIGTTDEHLIVCETNDTQVSITDGASPYILTINVPSWVQGNAGSNTASKPAITYTYYTCNVTGGGLSGATRLVKQGDGVLNLPAAAFKHTGETSIWAGTVNFDGSMTGSPLWLNRFAELNSKGGHFKSIKADYASVVRPGGKDVIGSITVDETYKMGFGSRLVIDLNGDNQTADQLHVKTLEIETKNWKYGPQYSKPILELAGNVKAGKYLIGSVEEIKGSLDDIKFEGQGIYRTSLVLEGNLLYVDLGGVRDAGHVVWTGAISGMWDYANTANFMSAVDQTAEIFVSGDVVEFNDHSDVRTVTISEDMTVDTLIVDTEATGTSAYTFKGEGRIVAGAFVKRGSGTVTMGTDNTYKNGNFLYGGTTIVSTLASPTQAYGNLGGVQSAMKFVFENGAVLQNTAFVQNNSPLRMNGSEGGVINTLANFEQRMAVSGTVLTKRGTGTLSLLDNTALTRLIISGGTVAGSATPANNIELNNSGTINLGTTSSVPIQVNEGATANVNFQYDRGAYSNKLTGSGQVTVSYPLVNAGGYAARCSITGDWSAFTGTVVAKSAVASDGRFVFNNTRGLAKATLNIPAGVTVKNVASTFAIGCLTGQGTLSGSESLSQNAGLASITWNVGSDKNFTYEGVVTGACVFNKVGSDTMTVKGKWTHTGATAIKEGVVLIENTTLLGKGTLTLSSGTTMMGVTPTAGLTNSSYSISGLLIPGTTLNTQSGYICFGGKNVMVGSTGTVRFCLGRVVKPTTSTLLSGTYITNINALTYNGTIQLDFTKKSDGTPRIAPVVGDTLRLWSAVTSFSGSPKIKCEVDGYTFDTSRLKDGLLIVTGAPVGISTVNSDEEEDAEAPVYDLNGIRVDAEQPMNGTYIRKGKKIIIR